MALGLASATARADHPIFRCESQGHVTYSDVVCATAADKTEVAAESLNLYSVNDSTLNDSMLNESTRKASHAISSRATNAKSTAVRRANGTSIAEDQMRHKQRCKDFADQLDMIAEKIWAGPPGGKHAARANRLADRLADRLLVRQRKLEQQRHDEKCH